MNIDLTHVIYMKYGYHALEAENEIIKRKIKEFQDENLMYWGYGGSACDPIKQVQPYLEHVNSIGKKAYLIMSFTKSKPTMEGDVSKEYSIDDIKWERFSKNIKVTGSKHAIVCGELKETNFDINLSNYSVAWGPSKGKNASDYIKGQSDKGCLIQSIQNDKQNMVKIKLLAEIIKPYAVKVR